MKRFGPLALVAFGALAAVWSARFWPAVAAALPPCPFRSLTGLPCPTCGTTRAFLALSELRVRNALTLNPLATLAALLGGLSAMGLAVALAFGARLPAFWLELERRWPWWLRGLVLLGVFANWLWVFLHA